MEAMATSTQGVIYLAAPYTLNGTAEPEEMNTRVKQVTRAANQLMMMGLNVFSPVTHSHAINKVAELEFDTADWLRKDFGYLKNAKGMYVLMLDGWENSIGVRREIEYARDWLGMPVMFLYPDKFILTGEITDGSET